MTRKTIKMCLGSNLTSHVTWFCKDQTILFKHIGVEIQGDPNQKVIWVTHYISMFKIFLKWPSTYLPALQKLFSDFGVSLTLIILTQNLNYVWDCRPLHLWIFNWKEIYLGGFVLEGWVDLQQCHQDLKYQLASASAASILLRGCLFLLFPLELYSVIWALINPEK